MKIQHIGQFPFRRKYVAYIEDTDGMGLSAVILYKDKELLNAVNLFFLTDYRILCIHKMLEQYKLYGVDSFGGEEYIGAVDMDGEAADIKTLLGIL